MELLEGALERQIVERDVRRDQDVLHFEADSVLALHVQRGVVSGCTSWDLAGASADEFLLDHYARNCPAELIVNQVEDRASLEQRLAAATGHRVKVTLAHTGRGATHQLMKLCALNHAHWRAARQTRSSPGPRGQPQLRVSLRSRIR